MINGNNPIEPRKRTFKPWIFDRGFHIIQGGKGSGKSVFLKYILAQSDITNKQITGQNRDYLPDMEEYGPDTDLDAFEVVIFDDFAKYFVNSNWNNTASKKLIEKIVSYTVDTRHTWKIMFLLIQDDVFKSFDCLWDSLTRVTRVSKYIRFNTVSRDHRYTRKNIKGLIPILQYKTVI